MAVQVVTVSNRTRSNFCFRKQIER